jgi:hypothetical protein
VNFFGNIHTIAVSVASRLSICRPHTFAKLINIFFELYSQRILDGLLVESFPSKIFWSNALGPRCYFPSTVFFMFYPVENFRGVPIFQADCGRRTREIYCCAVASFVRVRSAVQTSVSKR